MNPKAKAFLMGGLEALGIGFVAGAMTVWPSIEAIDFTRASVVAAATAGAKYGIGYFVGYLRLNRRLGR